jgi:hypothetical protein
MAMEVAASGIPHHETEDATFLRRTSSDGDPASRQSEGETPFS